MAKPTTHQHNNIPCEACAHFTLADGWVIREDICPESLQIGDVETCPPLKWWPFKVEDIPNLKKCEMHGVGEIPKCPNPYHATGKLRVFSAPTLGGLAMNETHDWPDARRGEYYDALVEDGVNAERNAFWVAPGDPLDVLTYPPFLSRAHWDLVLGRLEMIRARDLLEIMTITPYGVGISEADARRVIQATKSYLPTIKYECVNEPGDTYWQNRLAEILLEEGVPAEYIQMSYVNDSAWVDFMDAKGLWGRVTWTYHRIGSMATVDSIFIPGGNAVTLLNRGGFCGSNDGPDITMTANGLNFRYLEERGVYADRGTPAQISEVAAWHMANARGFEDLTAAGHQQPTEIGPDGGPVSWPNIGDAISLGRQERLALAGR